MTRVPAALAAIGAVVALAACSSSHPAASAVQATPAAATSSAAPTPTPTPTPSPTPTVLTTAQAGALYLHLGKPSNAQIARLNKYKTVTSSNLRPQKAIAKKLAADNWVWVKAMRAADWPVNARADIKKEISEAIDEQDWYEAEAEAKTASEFLAAWNSDKGLPAANHVRADLGLPPR